MKRIFILILAMLVSTSAFAGTKYLKGDKSAPGTLSMETSADLTLFVRTAGNDGNGCLASGDACLTINEALSRVPKAVNHAVLIDVGTGDFAEFEVSKFVIGSGGSLNVTGVLGAPTLAGGTATGTATSGDTGYLIDSGQSWVADDMIGDYVLVGADYRMVRDNTDTRIDFLTSYWATTSGEAYSIVEPKSVVATGTAFQTWLNVIGLVDAGGTWGVSNFYVNNSTGIGGNVQSVGRGSISRVRVDGADVHGFQVTDISAYVTFNQIGVTNSTYGGLIITNSPQIGAIDAHTAGNTWSGLDISTAGRIGSLSLLSTGNGQAGLVVVDCGYVNGDSIWVDGNTGDGAVIWAVKWFDWDTGSASSNTGGGVTLDKVTADQYAGTVANLGTLTMSSNGASAVRALNRSSVYLVAVTGTGNTGYGIEVECDSTVKFKTATTVTGTVADATIDEASTTLDYGTDFPTDRIVSANTSLFTRLERQD